MQKKVRLNDWVSMAQKEELTKMAALREDHSRSALLREILFKVLKVK